MKKSKKYKMLMTITLLMGYMFLLGTFLIMLPMYKGVNTLGFIFFTISACWLVLFFTVNVRYFT
jgi:hypothetical protein